MRACYLVACIQIGKNKKGTGNAFTNLNHVICKLCILSIGDRYNHCCAICKSPEAGGKFNKRFMIDKDNKGNIRGLICKSCKVVLVEVGDNIHTLESMIEYLHKEKQ